MGKVIGIDLGTTNSCVAICEGKRTFVIPNKSGYKTTPSVVGFLPEGQRLVGQVAKRQIITNPKNTVYSAKRLIGRRINSSEAKVADALYPYELFEGPHGDIRIRCEQGDFSLPEISSYVLGEMKRVAEEHLGTKVQDAVITVPAYFSDAQRQATKDAGKIAGLNVLRIINEPTAAAIAYGYNKKDEKRVAVYDFGGGTFDISILEIMDGVFKVIATSGDTFLGGEDIDNVLVDHVAESFLKENGVDLRENLSALQRLKEACEKAKCDLSQYREAAINLPFIENASEGPIHLNLTINRALLEELTQPMIDKTIEITADCLRMARMGKEDLDDVLLIGGQTRTPFVQDRISNFFGRSAARQVHPDEAVAIGAAIQGYALVSEDETEMLLLDVTPLPLGIQSAGGMFTRLIEANTTVPVSKTKVFTTVKENQETVRIQVFQGDKPVAEENELLGEFALTGIRKAGAGEPEIEVRFDIDANGIVQVAARDLDTGKEQSITVTMSSGLTPEEIEDMRVNAKDYDVAVKDQEDAERLAQKAEVLAHRLRGKMEATGAEVPDQRKQTFQKLLDASPGFISQKDPKKLVTLVEQLELVLKEFS